MKRSSKTVLVLAASVFTFAACNKVENEIQNDQDFYYTFTLGNPDTKAILASDSQGKFGQWEEGDRIGQAINDANPGYAAITLPTGESPASFKIFKTGGLEVDDIVYTYYPYNSSASSKAAIPFTIPVNQNQSGSDFDFDAMPMAGEPFVVTTGSNTNQTPVGDIQLANLGSVVDFQVYSTNATYATETILSVKLSANKAIAGAFSKDISSVKINDESTLSISGYTETDVTTTINTPDAIGATRDAASHVYMVIAPETDVTGSVLVTTNKAKYTFTISSAQSFKRAGLKSFGLNLANCGNRVEEEASVPVIVSKTIKEVLTEMGQANVADGTKVNPLIFDSVVTVSTTGTTNNGKVYGTGTEWRLYQGGNGNVIVSVAAGYELQSVQFTYSTTNGGTLDGAASGNTLDVSGSSVTYSVANTGSATNGLVRLTALTVKYVSTGASTPSTYAVTWTAPDNGTISAIVGGTAISSGDTFEEGTVVNITATPSTGYSFSAWSITGATLVNSNNASTSFTVGKQAVNFSASFTSNGGGGNPTTTTYTFTSASWGDSTNSWTSGKAGNGYTAGQGIQVTTGSSGANATSKVSFNSVSKIVVTYNTNKSAGAGSIVIKIGSNSEVSNSVSYSSGDGRSSNYTTTFDFATVQTGTIKVTANTTTNSIWVKSIEITHN